MSRSGYYNWIRSEEHRQHREEQDRKDFEVIRAAYQFRGYKKGARSIYMRLLHQEPPVRMNIKKIRRLMEKFGLICPVRRENPYRRMMKAMRTSHIAENLLNRDFTGLGARMVLLTDITYISFHASFYYLSTILDAFTRQILAHVLSDSLAVDFVLDTVHQLIENHGVSLSTETLIHSDQGSHYTSCQFIRLIKDSSLRQSMSRKGNCWDNAPQESSFGHMKDEIDLSLCQNFSDVKAAIDDWVDYYNNDRYQWQLEKLSLNEYFAFIVSGVYPLQLLSDMP